MVADQFLDPAARTFARTVLAADPEKLLVLPDNALTPGKIASTGLERVGQNFEIDHRVPLCLGGADVRENLWPQEGWQRPGYHDKDRLETAVCRAVCGDGSMSLERGQAIFLGDWIDGYQQFFGEAP